jgi:hypothetical protein
MFGSVIYDRISSLPEADDYKKADPGTVGSFCPNDVQ